MWQFHNPVRIYFGAGVFSRLDDVVQGRRYALVTYDDPVFAELSKKAMLLAGEPGVVINDIKPNPDFASLAALCDQCRTVDLIVALGGGSVIDTAKVLSAADGNFERVSSYLLTGQGELASVPIVAVPTTSGTGSEVTSWATVWHQAQSKKFSLARTSLYPEVALVDPELTLGLPLGLSISTGLDALSHALESLWNINRNPVSTELAIMAARAMIDCLPKLPGGLANIDLRSELALASLRAGLAFSNTKTSLAHSLSYPMTLKHGVVHGHACSFTLPLLLESVVGLDNELDRALREIFGKDLAAGAGQLTNMLQSLGVATDPACYGVTPTAWREYVDAAFEGARGKNFLGDKTSFLAAAKL